MDGGPAAGGLRVGDVILSLNGKPIVMSRICLILSVR